MMEPVLCLEKNDEYQANIERSWLLGTNFRCGGHVTHLVTFRAPQTSTVVKNALNSLKKLGTSYNNSGNLKCLCLRGGVSKCERIETSLSEEIVIMGISCLEVSL